MARAISPAFAGRRFLFITALWAAISAAAVARALESPGGGWAYPPDLDATALAAACGTDGTVLEQWLAADLAHDPKVDGLRGTMLVGADLWVRDSATLAAAARVQKFSGPTESCTGFDVEVWSPGATTPRRVRDKDLDWLGQLRETLGVLELDVTDYWAVVPGLRIGDRVRMVWHLECHRLHGLPIVDLQVPRSGSARASVEVAVPAGHALAWELAGPDSLVALVAHTVTQERARQRHRWEYRDGRDAGTRLDERRGANLTLVPHLSVTKPAAGTFVAAGEWAAAAAAYRERIAGLLEPTPALVELAQSLCVDQATTAERITALHAHVQATTRYLGLFNERGGIIPAAPALTRQRGFGDCKGLSAYFIALCRAAGLPAWPALALAGDDRHVARQQPNLAQFNHFIAWVDDGRGGLWVDPTLEGLPPGTLVPEVGLQPALLMASGREGLVDIPRASWDPGVRLFEVEGRIDESRALAGSVSLVANGPGGCRLRQSLAAIGDAAREEARLREIIFAAPLGTAALAPEAGPGADNAAWKRHFRTPKPLAGNGSRLFVPAEIARINELALVEGAGAREPIDPRRLPDRRETWRLELPVGWALAPADSIVVEATGLRWRRVVRQSGTRLELERSIDWADTALTAAQAGQLGGTLAGIARRERNPLQLVWKGQ